jgi:hypothetical protein
MTALIAEDDRVQALLLSTRISDTVFKVTEAYDATQAWTAAIPPSDAMNRGIQLPRGAGS